MLQTPFLSSKQFCCAAAEPMLENGLDLGSRQTNPNGFMCESHWLDSNHLKVAQDQVHYWVGLSIKPLWFKRPVNVDQNNMEWLKMNSTAPKLSQRVPWFPRHFHSVFPDSLDTFTASSQHHMDTFTASLGYVFPDTYTRLSGHHQWSIIDVQKCSFCSDLKLQEKHCFPLVTSSIQARH